MTLDQNIHETPVGRLRILTSPIGVRAILWPSDHGRVPLRGSIADRGSEIARRVATQLDEYFAGSRQRFDLPLDVEGTAFQRDVWGALTTIPYGSTITYGRLAAQLGRPTAARAVGAANGRNPISIVVPCHRLIGSSGALTGFAGGLDVKRRLIDLEAAVLTTGRPAPRP